MANSMQIKSNKEVRDYKEIVYFGMTVRQLFIISLRPERLSLWKLAQNPLQPSFTIS